MNSDVAPEDPGQAQRRLRFELILSSVCLAVGLFVLPALIYTAGAAFLGPYGEDAGLATFYGNFFGDLAGLSGRAWAIALSPLVTVYLIRAIFLRSDSTPTPPAAAVAPPPKPADRPPARSRAEPRITLD